MQQYAPMRIGKRGALNASHKSCRRCSVSNGNNVKYVATNHCGGNVKAKSAEMTFCPDIHPLPCLFSALML
jgi:hypothetical protein